MKNLLLLFVTLGLVTLAFAGDDIRKEFTISEGKTLDINLKSGGSIEISGWDKELASIRVNFRNCDPDDFDFDKKSSEIRIRSDYKRRVNRSNIKMNIKIPRNFDIKIKTIGGSVYINNIHGNISGRTAGGELNLKNLNGEINFTSGGGSVIIKDSKLDGRVSTGGGSVLVENVEGDIKATSGGGNVVYKNVKTPDKIYPSDLVYIRNAGGELDVDDAPAGADISTGGGNIYVKSAKKFVKARTGGGDIYIKAVDGWIKASTGAGDIEATMVGDPRAGKRDVTFITGSGDIRLTVPKDLSMTVDIELAYTKNSSENYKIISDFDLSERCSKRWNYDHGTPRKFIYGSAEFNGGKNLIKINSVNGNVYLKYK